MDLMILGFRPTCILRLLSLSDHRTFCSRSCIWNDRCTLQGSRLRNCRQTCRSLPLFQFIRRYPEFATTLRRPRRLLKIRKSTAHDNRISLKHTPRKFTTASIDHRMCETIGKNSMGLNLEATLLTPSSSSLSMTRSFKEDYTHNRLVSSDQS